MQVKLGSVVGAALLHTPLEPGRGEPGALVGVEFLARAPRDVEVCIESSGRLLLGPRGKGPEETTEDVLDQQRVFKTLDGPGLKAQNVCHPPGSDIVGRHVP